MTHPLFDKIKELIDAQEFAVTDILRMPATFARTAPVVSNALLFHAIDYMDECDLKANHEGQENTEIAIASIISEAYRRTFFDPAAAAKYGTQDIASNEESVAGLVRMLFDNMGTENQNLEPSPQAFFVPGQNSSVSN